jgi:hypothetical protein
MGDVLNPSVLAAARETKKSRKGGFAIREVIYSAGAIAVVAATIAFWSKQPVVSRPQVMRASTVGTGDPASEAMETISPLEIMVKHGKNLPVEYWSDPF